MLKFYLFDEVIVKHDVEEIRWSYNVNVVSVVLSETPD